MSALVFPHDPEGGDGLTIRDHFAASIVAALLIDAKKRTGSKEILEHAEEVVFEAYEIADMMMEERKN